MADEINNEELDEQLENQAEQQNEEQAEQVSKRPIKDIVQECVAQGAIIFKKLKIKNIKGKPMDYEDLYRYSFILDKEIPAYMSKDNGVTYVESKNNTVFSSNFVMKSILCEMDGFSSFGEVLINKPKIGFKLFAYAEISVMQQRIKKGVPYHNPFSNGDKATIFDHDTIINHVIGIDAFGKEGKELIANAAKAAAASIYD